MYEPDFSHLPNFVKDTDAIELRKERIETKRFWAILIVSILALIVSAISLFLQVRGLTTPTTQKDSTQNVVPTR